MNKRIRIPENPPKPRGIDLLDQHRGKSEEPCKSNPDVRAMTAAEWEGKLSAEGMPSRLPTIEREMRRHESAVNVDEIAYESYDSAPDDPRLRKLYELYHQVRDDFTAIEHAVFWTRIYGGSSLTQCAKKFKCTPSAISHATSRILTKLNAARRS